MIIICIFILFIKVSLFLSEYIDDKNHCIKFNTITKLCLKCDLDIYAPDEKGGCKYAHKCEIGLNQCDECNENGELCKKCLEGYYPDENGGCSYSDNCEISYNGKCLKCKEDYILIGEEVIKICKSLNFGDLKNCEEINKTTGFCQKCKEGYYLNNGDRKCTSIENCYKSVYDVCTRCNKNYYLDKKDNQCKNQIGVFEFCQESVDGKTCDICDDNYYFDENGKCIDIIYCKTSNNLNICEKCIDGYFLSEYNISCVSTDNCLYGDKDIGICKTCKDNYYLDYNDGKCKSNQEENDFKYCTFVDNNICHKCSFGHELGEDNKCSSTKYCAESSNGKCISCIDNYYLGLDFNCFNVEHCIYSDGYNCKECKDNYYYDRTEKKCKLGENNFKNCKSGDSFCESCKDDFYLNRTDNLCYSNKDYGAYYKCSKTDYYSGECAGCIEGYYLGYEDNKCTLIEGCALSENENKCLECDQYYCLNVKTSQCICNDIIEDEDKKYYFRCNRTDEEGKKCEVCEENLFLDENGLCIDNVHCEEKNEDGTCKKCQNNNEGMYCLNKEFGCVDISFIENCLECDNLSDFYYCTKCFDGFTLDNGKCFYNI
jgi:hypothetical protein